MRLDVYIKEKVGSRNKAQTLINDGKVLVNGKICRKSAYIVLEKDDVNVLETEKYVGRGGYKLEAAINTFNIDLNGKICLDVGASTGGFTQCMLFNNAQKIYAVDVGKGQLAKILLENPKVINLEQTDIRTLTLSEKIDFCSIDVSFISLTKILPAISKFDIKEVVTLVKPQFEAGRKNIGKNGIVKDEKVRKICIENIIAFASNLGYNIVDVINSPIKGGDGNVEFLLYLSAVG
ncbi:TlyA family rRNA (cytidine-2'-O)-methyltransferase [Clostridia bacterium]|nr:TlyA family rRNA (cytidine-2'-O)-methyltransferase [Clostridia bacterium]